MKLLRPATLLGVTPVMPAARKWLLVGTVLLPV